MAPTSQSGEVVEDQPLLSDCKGLVFKQLDSPASTHKWSASCQQVAHGSFPPMDPTSLLISPLSSFFGNAILAGISGLWIACLLSCTELRLYRPIWLILYLCDLSRQLQESYGVIGELQTVSSGFSSVMKDQAEVAGRALASFWVVKYHLWLSQSQSQLQQGHRDFPVQPSAMFGQDTTKLLQQTAKCRHYAQEVSGGLSGCTRDSRRQQPGNHLSPSSHKSTVANVAASPSFGKQVLGVTHW